MRRALVFALVAGSAAAVDCSLFVDLGDLQNDADGGALADGATTDGPISSEAGADGSGTCNTDLTSDARNCGACGHDCLGGSCSNRVCQPYLFSRFDGQIGDLECDDEAAYWLVVETSHPGVHRRAFADVGGGVPLFDVSNNTSEIAVDATHIYVSSGNGDGDGGVVLVADKTAVSTPKPLATYGGNRWGYHIALDDQRVFLGEYPGADDGLVGVYAKDGGTYVATYPTGFNYLETLAQSNGTLYAVLSSGVPESIRALSVTGGPYTEVTGPEGVSEASNLALDDAGLAWITYAGHVGYYDRVNGGAVRELFADGGAVTSVGIGSDKVYAAVDPDAGAEAGTVVAMDRDGANLAVVANGQAHPRMLRACGKANVWVVGADTIMAQAR